MLTYREWVTIGLVMTFLIAILAIAITAQPSHAETLVGPETQISLADICPN